MNMSERLPGLQRRAGRRKSSSASPSSPTFQRKHWRSQDLTTYSPSEPFSAITPGDSPLIDLTVPSPTFDLASISPALAADNDVSPRPQPVSRASDEFGKTRPRFLSEAMRPATSSASGGISYATQKRPGYSPEPGTLKELPQPASQRTSGDAPRRSSSRGQEDESAQRAAAFWAQYDRSASEDAMAAKNVASNKKSRFNLLNPMNLLARRRSSQNTNKLDDLNVNMNNLSMPAIPNNFEPSIRGTIVHDFSAPRTRKLNNENSPRPGPNPSPSYPRRPSELTFSPNEMSAGTPASMHSPMFKEHFQEERRPVQPTNTAYLHAQNLNLPAGGALPSFAKNLPLNLPSQDGETAPEDRQENVPASESTNLDIDVPPQPEMSPPPPPPPPKKTPSPVHSVAPAQNLPKHMTSTSSRFSFIGQQGSRAQEKLLEDKHKEHTSRNPPPPRLSMASIDDMDDYDDYDGLEEDDGFDNEEITIRNIDLPSSQLPLPNPLAANAIEEEYTFDDNDEYAFGTGDVIIRDINMPTSHELHQDQQNQQDPLDLDGENEDTVTGDEYDQQKRLQNTQRRSLQAFHFTPQYLNLSPDATQHTTQSTPRDSEGLRIGMANDEEFTADGTHTRTQDGADQSSDSMFLEGLGISTAPVDSSTTYQPSYNRQQPFDDFDLYFDDGEFDNEVVENGASFDENMLDDGSRIKDIPAENARKYEEALQRSVPGENPKILSNDIDDQIDHDLPRPLFQLVEPPEVSSHQRSTSDQIGLTEDNLAAHHDALTVALNKAAAKGSFDRTVSFSQISDDETDSPFHNSIPGISSRGSRYSNIYMSSGLSDEEGFGVDDDLDDDAMIAAANAEALENDDDGFYGQEFGFYARTHGRDSADFVNGGYFASRGSNGIKRSHSGKNNFQEPSLTPITERSEWSTRNSVASFPLHTGYPGMGNSLPSPGIAQLLERDSPLAEDEMSLSALMKLRGRAFGGSSSSINSLGERQYAHSSPLAHVSPYNAVHGETAVGKISSPIPGLNALSIAESDEEDEDGGRQTLTQNTPHKKHIIPARDASRSSREQEPMPSSPVSRKGNHSRNSSGAESVSYAREIDGRWVLERRRTGDDGELEVIGREYLAGARI